MRTTVIKRGIAGAVALATVVALSACTPSAVIRSVVQAGDVGSEAVIAPYDDYSGDAGSSESGFVPVEVDGPVDWADLAPCDADAGALPWVLVSTFPSDEIDNADIYPFCGDAFIPADGDSFVGAVATVTQYEIYLLGGKLTSAGYVLVSDDFDPTIGEGRGQYLGAREYTLGDTTLVISAYDNGVRPLSLTVFLDFYSPQTRALSAASAS